MEVLTIDRDASTYNQVPEGTWLLAFGWYMHAIFGMRYAFPLHANLRPIFVSFHCNKRELLTPDAVSYLRRHAPIGCRDHTTVDILLSLDVPAFFSGCVTTTIDTVFPELPDRPGDERPVAYIDPPEDRLPAGAAVFRHSSDEVRFNSFTTNMYDAMELLEGYRRDYSAAVTSRLHAYLPLRSLGVPVDFQPRNRADLRFPGLIDISDDEFDRIRGPLLEKLEHVVGRILQGADVDEVYAEWRRINEPAVEEARRRRDRPAVPPAPHGDLDHQVDRAVAGTRTQGGAEADSEDTVHVAVRYRAARNRELAVLLESLAASTSRPVHVWLLDSGRRPARLDRLADRFPGLTFSAVPTAGLGVDLHDVSGGRVDGLEMLVLPRLLPHVGRVALLPLGAVVERDVAGLFEMDLDGRPIAAPSETRADLGSGFGVIHTAATRLAFRTAAAEELRRRAHGRHAFDFDAFSLDVAVFDLDRIRDLGLLDEGVGLAEEFGLSALEVLHFVVGPDRAVLPEEWWHVPTRTVCERPSLLHWADEVKPWDSGYVEDQERWLVWRTQAGDRR